MKVIYGSGGGGGKKGGGGGGEADNTVKAKSTARILMLVSEGKTGGLYKGAKSIFVNDVPLQNNDDSYNIKEIKFDTRTGLPDQTYMSGFPAVEAEQNVGLEVKKDISVTQAVTNLDATAVRVKLRIPSLTSTDTKKGKVNGNSVKIAIDIRNEAGVFSEVVSDTISEKFTSPYERGYRIELPGTGPWYIRMRRLSEDSNNTTNLNATYFSAFTIIEDYKLSYPDCAMLGLIADAEQLGSSFPVITVEWDGIEVEIPNNFDPINRVYTGVWDGTFKLGVTDDPAWIFRDLIVNERYGLGDIVSESFVDKWSLYEISRYCNELVDNGYGGKEPRFRFNGTISSRDEAIRVLMAMAGVFRGIVYWGSGMITAVCDKPTDSSKLVAPANVVDGNFNYQGASLSARHTQAVVKFFDPEDAYKPALEVVEDYEGMDRFGLRPTQFQAIGCISRGQAHRYGKWLLDTEQHETEIVTFRVGLDHADVAPGEVVDVADPAYAGARMGGRIKSLILTNDGKVSGVVLDAPVDILNGETYSFSVVVGDGAIEERVVIDLPGTRTTLNFQSPLDGVPIIGAMWILIGSNAAPRPFRIISVIENEKHQFDVTAMFYDETKYLRVEQDIILEPPAFSTYPTGQLLQPTNLSIEEYVYRTGGNAVRTAVTFGWTPPNDPRVTLYEVQILDPVFGDFRTIATTSDLTIDIEDLEPGVYSFRVRSSWELSMARSEWASLDSVLLNKVNAPPDNVENFKITVLGDVSTLTWNPCDSINFSHYVLRYTPELAGAEWNSAILLFNDLNVTSVQIPTRPGSYLIKSVNFGGFESEDAAIISTNASGAILNAFESFVEQPEWAGIKTGVSKDGDGYLRLGSLEMISDWENLSDVVNLYFGTEGISLYGTYLSAQTIDLGDVYTSRVTPLLSVYGDNLDAVMKNWTTLAEVQSISGTDPSQWACILQVRYTKDNPSSPSADWSEWAEAQTGDIEARGYQLKLILISTQSNITPVVRRAELIVDMPDRVFGQEDIVVPIEGLRVDFFPPYKALKGLAISAQGLNTGDYYEITSKDATGFNIIFKDSSNNPVEKTMDYVATGYGRVS